MDFTHGDAFAGIGVAQVGVAKKPVSKILNWC